MSKRSLLCKLTLQPGKRVLFDEAMSRFFSHVQKEPGTEVYVVNSSKADPNVIWLFEIFSSDEAYEQDHCGSDADQAMIADVMPLLAGSPEIIHCSPLHAKVAATA